MTKLYNSLQTLVVLVCLIAISATTAWAQAYTFTPDNLTYTQNFDVLGTTQSTSAAYPTGWRIIKNTGSSATIANGATLNTIHATSGTNTSGGAHNVGTDEDRALGMLASGTVVPRMGASFVNNTGAVITSVNLSAFMEQWRESTAASLERNVFAYSLDATDLLHDAAETPGTWTPFTSMDLVEINEYSGANNTNSPLDGNLDENRTAISGIITDINWANGATLWIRWTDTDVTGSDALLAIDDFTMTVVPQAATTTPTITLAPTSLEPFTTTVGTASAIQTYTVSGQNLAGNVVISAPEHMELRLGTEGVFSNELTFTPVNNTLEAASIQVRVAATAPAGAITGNITHVSQNANNPSLAVTGTVTAVVTAPTITTTGTLQPFIVGVNRPSAAQIYTVSGSNLTDNIVINAPEGYELRLGTEGEWSNRLTLVQEEGAVESTEVRIRLASKETAGTVAGNVTHATEGIEDVSVAVTGTVVTITPLSQVKAVDGQGVSNMETQVVTVRGTIHGVNLVTAANQHQYTIIDNTDGVLMRVVSTSVYTNNLVEGDSVEATGTVTTFRGLAQVNNVTRIDLIGNGIGTIRTPRVVTVLNEATESQLVTLQNVAIRQEGDVNTLWNNEPGTMSGFNVVITTADGVEHVMRIARNSELFGKTYAEVFGTATRANVTGLGGQFTPTNTPPFADHYQIFPYKLTHITPRVTTSLSAKMDAAQVAVYPNPASDRFVVEAYAEGTSTVTVYSITGQRMTSKEFNKSVVIETAGFNSGMYMLHISNGANTVVKKVSVVR